MLFLPGIDELMRFSDAVIPADLLCSNVVSAIFDLSRARVHIISVQRIWRAVPLKQQSVFIAFSI